MAFGVSFGRLVGLFGTSFGAMSSRPRSCRSATVIPRRNGLVRVTTCIVGVLLLEGIDSPADLCDSLLGKRIHNLENRLEIFKSPSSTEDDPELRQQANTSISDLGIRILQNNLFQFVFDRFENELELLDVLGLMLDEEVLLYDQFNAINHQLFDAWILVGGGDVVDEEIEKFCVGQAPIRIDCIKSLFQGSQDRCFGFLIFVRQETAKLLNFGDFDGLLEQDGEVLDHLDSLDEDEHVRIF